MLARAFAGRRRSKGPALDLDFTRNVNVIHDLITVSGGANGTRVNSAGAIEAKTAPRLDFDPASGRTNLFAFSVPDHTNWTAGVTDGTPNYGTAPDGTPHATYLTTSTNPGRYMSGQTTPGTAYTFSQFVKCGPTDDLFIYLDGTIGMGDVFQTASAAFANPFAAPTLSDLASAAACEALGGDWYRVSLTYTPLGGAGANCRVWGGTANPMEFWGFHLEEGSEATDYIATSGAARTVYDCEGLLIEEARTNLVQQSEALATLPWQAAVVTATNAFASALGLSFTRISGGLNTGVLYQPVTFNGDGTKCFALFVKQDGAASGDLIAGVYDFDAVTFRGGATVSVAANGVVTAVGKYGGTILDVEDWGSGVYRVLVQVAGVVAANANRLYASDSGNATLASVLLAGAQAENAPAPSSYIPTGGAPAARTADSAIISGTNFSSWFNANEGTFVVEFTPKDPGETKYMNFVQLRDDAAGANYMSPFVLAPSGTLYVSSKAASVVTIGDTDVGTVNWDAVNKVAIALTTAELVVSLNGAAATTLNGAVGLAAFAMLSIGADGLGSTHTVCNSPIRRTYYWPRRLSNAELQALTAA